MSAKAPHGAAPPPPRAVTPEPAALTLGEHLEHRRLQLRHRRLEAVVTALHGRADEHRQDWGSVRRPLRMALEDFSAELESVAARLHRLRPGDRSG